MRASAYVVFLGAVAGDNSGAGAIVGTGTIVGVGSRACAKA